jgi:hypothetical protein
MTFDEARRSIGEIVAWNTLDPAVLQMERFDASWRLVEIVGVHHRSSRRPAGVLVKNVVTPTGGRRGTWTLDPISLRPLNEEECGLLASHLLTEG